MITANQRRRRGKPNWRRVALLLFTGLIGSWSTSGKGATQSAPFEVGMAVVDITPPADYGHHRGPGAGVHDPLYAKAIVLKQGRETGALVVCDIIRITRDFSAAARRLASKQTGIPFQNISMTATHTHTGPRYDQDLQQYLANHRIDLETLRKDTAYPARLICGVVEAISRAAGSAKAVRLASAVGKAQGLSFHRRFLMSDGRVVFNPGFQNPNIVRPMGPVDPGVHILAFGPSGGSGFFSSLTVFANHLDTVGGNEYSADYPGYLSAALKRKLGSDFISVFGTGTCGNLNHFDVSRPAPQSGHEVATRRIGEALAQVFLDELPRLKSQTPDLAVRMETIFAPMQSPSSEEIAWTQGDGGTPLYPESPFLQGMRKRKILSVLEKRRTGQAIPPSVQTEKWTLPLDIHVFRLSREAAVVTVPGEVFVELGLEIQRRSPFANTMVIELANTDINYVPTREAFAHGAYETVNSRIDPGGGEMIVETALKLLTTLR